MADFSINPITGQLEYNGNVGSQSQTGSLKASADTSIFTAIPTRKPIARPGATATSQSEPEATATPTATRAPLPTQQTITRPQATATPTSKPETAVTTAPIPTQKPIERPQATATPDTGVTDEATATRAPLPTQQTSARPQATATPTSEPETATTDEATTTAAPIPTRRPIERPQVATTPNTGATNGTTVQTEEEIQAQTEITKKAQEHMNIAMSKNSSHEDVRKAIIGEMKAIFSEYANDPDTRDAVVAEFIKLIDKQQGFGYGNGDSAMSMEDNNLANEILNLYGTEPLRLMAVLNNSEIPADPGNKASVESEEWAKWGLNRILRYNLVEKSGAESMKYMDSVSWRVDQILEEEDPDKRFNGLKTLAQFVCNSGKIESGTSYQIDIAQARDIINGIDSSLLSDEQKTEIRSIFGTIK